MLHKAAAVVLDIAAAYELAAFYGYIMPLCPVIEILYNMVGNIDGVQPLCVVAAQILLVVHISRFTALQNKAKHPIDVDFDGEARRILEICKQDFFDMACALDLTREKEIVIKIIENLVFSIALINKTYTRSGWGKSILEISNMPRVPDKFIELCSTAICSEDTAVITNSIQLLIKNTAKLLTGNQHTCNIQNDFLYFYEEAKLLYNKLYNACDINDGITALLAGGSLQHEILLRLSLEENQRIGFPDLIADFYCNVLKGYKYTVLQHERCLVDFLHIMA